LNGHAAPSKVDSVVTLTPLAGNEPWPGMVRKLEKGALVEPAALATALFHELMEVRQRLDRLEKRALPEK